MRKTIKDVAEKAHVSTATVSLVIHGHKRISEQTRRKVKKVIKDLEYYPSRSARDLVSRKTGNIGFVLTEDHFLRTEPFYTQIFLGTEFEARQQPYYVLLATIPNEFTKEDPVPRFVQERSVDGLIIAGKVSRVFIKKLKRYLLPVVYVDYYPDSGEHSAVLIDNLNGGITATRHLIDCGHRAIGVIGGDISHPSLRDRFQGYKIALDQAKIKYKDAYVSTSEVSTSREGGYHATSQLLENTKDITALFACNDAMAIGAIQYLKEKNYKIPQDVSVIGFDDIEQDLFIEPTLTTMRVPKVDMGSEAMCLISEIVAGEVQTARKMMMPVSLVQRQSTCHPNR